MVHDFRAYRDGRTLTLTGAICLALGLVGSAEPPSSPAQWSPAAKAFNERVEQYVKIRDGAVKPVPDLKDTNDPAQIAAREKAMGDAIRQARPGAKEGELFNAAKKLFAAAVERYWKGLSAGERRELMDELPSEARPKPNTTYPTTYPLVTFPPTLLEQLPKLPEVLEYRLVGPHLILRDVQANLIVDVLPHATTGNRARGEKSK